MRGPAVVVALAALLGGCAQSRPAPIPEAAPDDRIEVEGFRIPRAAGGWELVETQPYPDRAFGSGARYASFTVPSARADVFLYEVQAPQMLSLADVLDLTAQQVMREAEGAMRMHYGAEPVLVSQSSFVVPSRPPLPGIRFEYRVGDGAQALRSHAFLAIAGDRYVKVRFSYPEEVDPVARGAFDGFLGTVIAEIASGRAEADPEYVAIVTRTTLEVASHGVPCAGLAWGVGYGQGMLIAIREGQFLDSYERELAARTAVLDVWERLRLEGNAVLEPATCKDATLDAMREVRAQGLLDEYVWRYFAKPYWRAPADLDRTGFTAYEKQHLSGHDPVIDSGVVIQYESAGAASQR